MLGNTQQEQSASASLPVILDCMCRTVPETMLSRQAHDRIIRFARNIPLQYTSFVNLEFLIDRSRPLPDVSINIDPRGAADERRMISSFPPSRRDLSGYWDSIESYIDKWARIRPARKSYIRDLWLEFDTPPSESNDEARPSVFICFKRLARRDRATLAWFLESVGDFYESMAGRAMSEPFKKMFSRCIEALPAIGSELIYTGIMAPRQLFGVRACIRMKCKDVAKYLANIGKKTSMIEEVSRGLCKGWENVLLDIDVEESVGDRIGIEFSFLEAVRNNRVFQWNDTVDRAITNHWCDPESGEAIRNIRERTFSAPPDAFHPDVITPDPVQYLIFTGRNHLKFIFNEPTRSISSKLYLYGCSLIRRHVGESA